jgi:hypothetical protein
VLVGVNYPWLDYGWDFGLGPPAWRGGRMTPRWYDSIDAHLQHFSNLGISVVRWFILADGLTYGTGLDAPTPDPARRRRWHFEPPPLSHGILEHFDNLLGRFASAAGGSPIQLLPVLIDFHFCHPGTMPVRKPDDAVPRGSIEDPAWVKGGRADAIADPVKRTPFLDAALEPLLEVSGRYSHVIYAWELINEPDWITKGWHPNPLRRLPVAEGAMLAFLDEGQRRIRRAGFRSTVGFALADTLRRSGITADINQVHHYPGGRVTLRGHMGDRETPRILGEFATTSADVWPDLHATGQRVLDRLRLADSRGYELAIPWSFLSQDRHTTWSPDVEEDLRAFARRGQSGDVS